MKKKKDAEPSYINSPLNNPMLNYKVYKMNPIEAIIIFIVFFAVGGAVGLLFYGGLFKVDYEATVKTYISDLFFFILVGTVAVVFGIPVYINARRKSRQSKLKDQFRNMLDSLSSSVSTGSNINKAFDSALSDLKLQYGEDEFIIKEVQEIVNGINQNIRPDVMLYSFAERTGIEDIRNFADVFDVCYRKGGNMRVVIARTNSVLSEKMEVADEIETKLTSNKMQHNIMSVMPIIIYAIMKYSNSSMSENSTSVVGVVVNTVAIAIFIGSYFMGQKMTDIKA